MSYRALSLTQPWATLVVIGAKRFETRSWRTSYRGWLGIHAAKGFPRETPESYVRELCGEEPFRSALKQVGIVEFDQLPRGALLGGARLVDCVPTDGVFLDGFENPLAGLDGRERAFGNYEPGRWAWRFDVAEGFEPRPMRGHQGLWPIPEAA